MTTLEFATTESMIDELKRRYPLLMILGSVDISKTNATDILCCQGNHLALIGLTRVMDQNLTTQYLDNLEPTDDTP